MPQKKLRGVIKCVEVKQGAVDEEKVTDKNK